MANSKPAATRQSLRPRGQPRGQSYNLMFFTRANSLCPHSPFPAVSMRRKKSERFVADPICRRLLIQSLRTLVCLRTSHANAHFCGLPFFCSGKSRSFIPSLAIPSTINRSASVSSCSRTSGPLKDSRFLKASVPSTRSFISSRNSSSPKHHPRRIRLHSPSTTHGFSLCRISSIRRSIIAR